MPRYTKIEVMKTIAAMYLASFFILQFSVYPLRVTLLSDFIPKGSRDYDWSHIITFPYRKEGGGIVTTVMVTHSLDFPPRFSPIIYIVVLI